MCRSFLLAVCPPPVLRNSLSSSFKQKYEPWLGIEAPTPMSPFLISVRCLIAARHLSAPRRITCISPLHSLCREHAMTFILSSTPNLASIQALHILSTWQPIESWTSPGQQMEVQNGGALIAAAIAHALNLRLDTAAEFSHSHPESEDIHEDVRFKAKMVSKFSGPMKHILINPSSGSVCAPLSSRKSPPAHSVKFWEG